MMKRFLLALVVLPGLSLAQTVPTVTMTSGTGIATASVKCGDSLTVTWTVDPVTGVQYCDNLQFWSEASSSCGSVPDAGYIAPGIAPGTFATRATGTINITTSDLNLGTQCTSPTAQTATATVCGGINYGSGVSLCGTPVAASVGPLVVTVFVEHPTVDGVSLSASDQTLDVTINTDSTIKTSTIFYAPWDGDAGIKGDWLPTTGDVTNPKTAKIENLTNGTVYCVQAQVADEVGQTSGRTPFNLDGGCLAPEHIDGFYTRFYAGGGRATGCSLGGEGGLLGLALAGLSSLLFRRKR